MTTVEKYVTAAYLVVFVAVLAYVVIMAAKLARLEHDVDELTAAAERREERVEEREVTPVA